MGSFLTTGVLFTRWKISNPNLESPKGICVHCTSVRILKREVIGETLAWMKRKERFGFDRKGKFTHKIETEKPLLSCQPPFFQFRWKVLSLCTVDWHWPYRSQPFSRVIRDGKTGRKKARYTTNKVVDSLSPNCAFLANGFQWCAGAATKRL